MYREGALWDCRGASSHLRHLQPELRLAGLHTRVVMEVDGKGSIHPSRHKLVVGSELHVECMHAWE